MAWSLLSLSRHKRFPIVPRGYDPVAVDSYLGELEGGNLKDPQTTDEIINKMFPVVKKGYDRARVHRYTYALVGTGGGEVTELVVPEMQELAA